MIKKYNNFINEEVGFRNLKSIAKKYKTCEIFFHMDLDGLTSALSIKEFFKNFYQIKMIDCHVIQYGNKEFSMKQANQSPDNLPIIVDFAHSKVNFLLFDHHDKQAGVESSMGSYIKKSRSNAEIISGEISYNDIFTPQDVELINTVDSANFLKYNITPDDIQNAIFQYKKSDSAVKNRFMMGFVVNRLLLSYKNKRITVDSLDYKREHKNKNILECLVLDSTGSLYSIFNNLRHYINEAFSNDRAGSLVTPEEINANLSDYIERMKNYKFIEDPRYGQIEYDPKNPEHVRTAISGTKVSSGVHFDEEHKIISQYGGGNLFKSGSYDRYVPFKNFPDAEFLCIIWPMGLIQVSCNPFKEKKFEDINLGNIAKEVLSKHEPVLKRFYISIGLIKKDFETSQDWKAMKKAEGEDYEGVGFKFSDLEANYLDCVYKKENDKIINVDIIEEPGIKEKMNKTFENWDQSDIDYMNNYKIPAWEIIIRNSGGHPSITNISGVNLLKLNIPALKISYNTEKYVDVLKTIGRDIINNLKEKIEAASQGKKIEYDTKGVELLGQEGEN